LFLTEKISGKFDVGNGLKASKIYKIIEDVEGNILISDQSNGLTIFKGDAFETINEKNTSRSEC
jgi:hypothetical protein